MTTSQASRVFGIPYNSLLMYVRGKYGKSLKLDVLKQKTPAANDNLNTIGNSRSTPKEKLGMDRHHPYAGNRRTENGRRFESSAPRPSSASSAVAAFSPYAAAMRPATADPSQPQQTTASSSAASSASPTAPGFGSFSSALFHNLPGLQEQMGLMGVLPHDSSRMRELLQNIHREQQNALHNRPISSDGNADSHGDEPKHVSSSSQEQVSPSTGVGSTAAGGGLLMLHSMRHPGSVGSEMRSMSRSPMTSEQSLGSGSVNGEEADNVNPEEEEEHIEIDEDRERQVQAILLKATQLKKAQEAEEVKEKEEQSMEEGKEKEEEEAQDIDNDPREPSPVDVAVPNASGEISAL